MPLKQKNPQGVSFFQIHKNGSAVDGVSYPSLEAASAAWKELHREARSSR